LLTYPGLIKAYDFLSSLLSKALIPCNVNIRRGQSNKISPTNRTIIKLNYTHPRLLMNYWVSVSVCVCVCVVWW